MTDLDAIRARAEAATPGPWEIYWDGILLCISNADEGIADDLRVQDAEFIVNARQDIPALLAEVERLTATVDEYRLGAELNRKAARADHAVEAETAKHPGVAEVVALHRAMAAYANPTILHVETECWIPLESSESYEHGWVGFSNHEDCHHSKRQRMVSDWVPVNPKEAGL